MKNPNRVHLWSQWRSKENSSQNQVFLLQKLLFQSWFKRVWEILNDINFPTGPWLLLTHFLPQNSAKNNIWCHLNNLLIKTSPKKDTHHTQGATYSVGLQINVYISIFRHQERLRIFYTVLAYSSYISRLGISAWRRNVNKIHKHVPVCCLCICLETCAPGFFWDILLRC